ncbi:hypothetical protein ACFE04_005480 [Oxalis oulophora]
MIASEEVDLHNLEARTYELDFENPIVETQRNLFLFNIVGVDIILGLPWLASLGDVTSLTSGENLLCALTTKDPLSIFAPPSDVIKWMVVGGLPVGRGHWWGGVGGELGSCVSVL